MRRAAYSFIVLLAISLGTLFFRLGSLPLSGADEPRYARIAQEMSEQGNWVTPILEKKPWLEKPPLYYWITIPFYSVFRSHETAARSGPALCALLTAMAIFLLGARRWSLNAGLLGAAILLTTLGLAGFGRSASTDIPFTCCLTLSLAILAAAVRQDIGPKVLFAYVFLGLAVLGKGPVAVILAAGICLCTWHLDERGTLVRNWRLIPGIAIAAAVSLPWFWLAFRENGYAFISTFIINHNIARYLTEIHHHAQPFYYYLPVLLGLLFPWSGWLLSLAKSPVKGLQRWRSWDPQMVFLTAWFLVPIVFFSLSGSKLAGYILPSLPPLALILGIRLSAPVDRFRLRAASAVHLALSTAMAAGAVFYFNRSYGGNWQVGLLLALAIFVPALVAFISGFAGHSLRAFTATAIQGVLLVVVLAQFGFPVLGAYHSTRDIAQLALQNRRGGEPIVTYRFFHHSLYYYTGYQVAGRIETPDALAGYGSCLVVTDVKRIGDLAGMKYAVLAKQGNFRLLRVATDSTN